MIVYDKARTLRVPFEIFKFYLLFDYLTNINYYISTEYIFIPTYTCILII